MKSFDKKVLVQELQKGRKPFLIKNGRAQSKNFKIRKTSEVLIIPKKFCKIRNLKKLEAHRTFHQVHGSS